MFASTCQKLWVGHSLRMIEIVMLAMGAAFMIPILLGEEKSSLMISCSDDLFGF